MLESVDTVQGKGSHIEKIGSGDFTEELAKRADIPAEVDALEDLEDDGGGVGDVPHLGDDPSEPVALQAENELPDEVAVSDDELIAELEKLLEEQDQENLQDVNAEGNGDEPEHVAVGNPEEDGRPRDGPAAPASVEAAPAAARHVPARGARAVPPVEGPELERGFFGIFKISKKSQGFGGYQANCPYHIKNQKTGCKRFFVCSRRYGGVSCVDTSQADALVHSLHRT